MMKFIFVIVFSFSFLFSSDNLLVKEQEVLYVQNLIKIEERIAQEFENYLLTEFKIPTISALSINDYLGANFSVKNILGDDIDFKSAINLQIKVATSKSEKSYVQDLYKRDLYRERTTVYLNYGTDDDPTSIDFSNSYVTITLQSLEAINIYNILKSGATINTTCDGVIISSYCNLNNSSIRWYNSASNWIEYDKKDFENGNVTVKNGTMLSDAKINDIAVGSYIFVEDSTKYVKLIDNNLLKVE